MIGLLLLAISIYLFHNGKIYSSLMIFFLFLTNGFQIIPVSWLMGGLPIDKGTDLAILYIIYFAWAKRGLIKSILVEYPIFKWCFYILVFVVLDVFYSCLVLDYSFVDVTKVFRPYLFLLGFIVFFSIPLGILLKFLHTIALITVFLCPLFLLQVVTGQIILFSAMGDENVFINQLQGGYVRYYNTPAFLIPALFYFMFVYRFNNNVKQYVTTILLLLTIVAPMHRSLIMATVAVLCIYVLVRQSFSKRIIYASIIGILIYITTFVSIIGDRIDEGLDDIRVTMSSSFNVKSIDIHENTSLFRIGHLVERLDYILTIPQGWLFGIGMISDNTPYAAKLPFQYGLISEATGQVIQVDTADLIWSPLLLTVGIIGTCLYIWFFLKLAIFFYSRISTVTIYASVGFLTILMSFATSMMGTEMLSNTFRIMVLLCAVIVCKFNTQLNTSVNE